MFRINQRALRTIPALVSLAWEGVIWEDMRGMIIVLNAIRPWRRWRAPGTDGGNWEHSTRDNSTQIHAKYVKFSEFKDKR